jgi:hypothetical protein
MLQAVFEPAIQCTSVQGPLDRPETVQHTKINYYVLSSIDLEIYDVYF